MPLACCCSAPAGALLALFEMEVALAAPATTAFAYLTCFANRWKSLVLCAVLRLAPSPPGAKSPPDKPFAANQPPTGRQSDRSQPRKNTSRCIERCLVIVRREDLMATALPPYSNFHRPGATQSLGLRAAASPACITTLSSDELAYSTCPSPGRLTACRGDSEFSLSISPSNDSGAHGELANALVCHEFGLHTQIWRRTSSGAPRWGLEAYLYFHLIISFPLHSTP